AGGGRRLAPGGPGGRPQRHPAPPAPPGRRSQLTPRRRQGGPKVRRAGSSPDQQPPEGTAMAPTPTPARPGRRRRPAARSRVVAGLLSAVLFLGLGAGMAARQTSATATTSAAAPSGL